MKRAFDILIAATTLLVCSPLLLLLGLLIRVRLGAPVLFTQMRPGKEGRPFTLIKFRTMAGVEPDGADPGDATRMTRLGATLRRWSLDELPELWNVLRGEMSLVGPRPLLPEYLPRYSADQARRHEVLPGITGWAQVNGRNAVSWEERFRLDIWYVDHRNFWLDLRILAMTLKRVFSREGINEPGQATMTPFQGA
jgi:lipopolysaccharide/colanic/teichoic acid biosynthesis glycosyltransferase